MEEGKKIPVSTLLYWTGTILVLLMTGVVGLFWKRLPPELPWLYSFPWGESQLIDKWQLFAVFGGMEVVLLATRLIARWAGKEDETVQNTVMIGVTVAVVLMLASFFRVMKIFLV